MVDEAIKKLDEGLKDGKFDRYGTDMKEAVHRALVGFCRQDREFAQAVVQGGSFDECMKAVGKAVKNGAISDIDAFTEAVRFYFPGAGIDVKMTIDLCAGVRGESGGEPAGSSGIVLSLLDFM